jgi:outer membrane protein OmpA-like peptidoglycan-associated protein
MMLPPAADPDNIKQSPAATKPPVSAVANAPTEIPQAPAIVNPDASILYAEAETDLPIAEQAKLQAIANKLAADKSITLNIMSFASGAADQAGQATRTSLARGLAVRRFFLERNIDRARINVRPLGNRSTSGVPDRVDVFLDKASKG